MLANSISPTKKGTLFLTPIGTKLVSTISWKISKISCERNMNMFFASWRSPRSKTAKEWSTVACETILYYFCFFFSFCKYLVIKDFVQFSKTKKKSSHRDKAPLIFCSSTPIINAESHYGLIASGVLQK